MGQLFDTPPLAIQDWPADRTHFTRGRGGFGPEFIVLHHSGGVDSRAWLSTNPASSVSTHRLIMKDGQIYKIVADGDTAYTAGFATVGPVDPDLNDPAGVARNFNQISLNIELENLGNGRDPYPLAQLTSAALQVVEWWGAYGFLPIVYHRHVDARKDDPRGFPRAKFDVLLRDHLRTVI